MLASIPLAVGGIFSGVLAGLLVVWLLAVCIFALVDRMLFPAVALQTERPLPPRLIIGRDFTMQIAFKNCGRCTAVFSGVDYQSQGLEGESRLSQFVLNPNETCTFPLVVRPLLRGSLKFGPLHIVQEPGLRLWRYHSVFDNGGKVKVYPDYQPGAESLDFLQKVGEVGIRRTRQRGEGTDFDCLREYRDGDDSARIDWKATSRLNRAVSRQYTIERDHDVIIGLDCGRLMGAHFDGVPKFDYTIRAALALAEMSIRVGDRVGLLVFDSKVRCFVPPAKGPVQLGRILEALYDQQSAFEETEFQRALTYLGVHHRKRSLVVMFTDFIDKHTAAPMIIGMAGTARRHACLFVAVEDPTLEERLGEAPVDLKAMGGQAVAYGMRSERAEVLEILRQQGIEVLNEQPDQLTAPVINSYLRLKDAGKI